MQLATTPEEPPPTTPFPLCGGRHLQAGLAGNSAELHSLMALSAASALLFHRSHSARALLQPSYLPNTWEAASLQGVACHFLQLCSFKRKTCIFLL